MGTSEAIRLFLPFPPSVNTYYRSIVVGGRPRVLISVKGREFQQSVAYLFAHTKYDRVGGRLSVTVQLSAPNRRKYDIDNRVKALLDAMEKAGVYENDEQVDLLTVIRSGIDKPNGCAVVTIEQV